MIAREQQLVRDVGDRAKQPENQGNRDGGRQYDGEAREEIGAPDEHVSFEIHEGILG